MTLADLISISAGNLWRMKLRTSLTVLGVVIAIAAFVSMLSFGAGNQKYITEQYNKLGLFTTMQVYPKEKEKGSKDSTIAPILDEAALEKLSKIPGVNLAYPYDAFEVTVTFEDTQFSSKAQALPSEAAATRLFSQIQAGAGFAGDSGRQALVTRDFVVGLGLRDPDSIIGRRIILTVWQSSLDSGLAALVRDEDSSIRRRLSKIEFDSLRDAVYRRRIVRREAESAISRFFDGYLNARIQVTDTLTICGVLGEMHGARLRVERMIIPLATARRFTSGGVLADPASLLASVAGGRMLDLSGDTNPAGYPQVTLDIDSHVPYEQIKDSVEAMGYRAFSFVESFAELQKFFFYYDLVLGIIGFIALVTASLGIVNTMIMSIIERTREIGVLKALGCDEGDIRLLFLVESGVIGAVGSIVGIFFGWIISRTASIVTQAIMAKQGLEAIELFALPLWLILLSFTFGLLVSILAGSYPARRASRVDPVVALRND